MNRYKSILADYSEHVATKGMDRICVHLSISGMYEQLLICNYHDIIKDNTDNLTLMFNLFTVLSLDIINAIYLASGTKSIKL